MIEKKQNMPYYKYGNGGKKWIGLLSQNATEDPSAVVLANTLGEITWTRVFQGGYKGELSSGSMTYGKTRIQVDNQIGGYIAQAEIINDTEVQIIIFLPLGGPADNVLTNTGVEITVYE